MAMSPELEALLEQGARAEQDAKNAFARDQEERSMAYRSLKGALQATSTFNRPRQF